MVEPRSQLTVEALGTALLLAIVIDLKVIAERLAGGDAAIALLANTAATVDGLYVLIEASRPISDAYFNPMVSAVMAVRGRLYGAALLPYIIAQMLGAMLGVWLAHVMFDMALLQFSTKVHNDAG